MPAELAERLHAMREELRVIAVQVDEFLTGFFDAAWEECNTEFEHKGFEYVKCDDCGQKTKKRPTRDRGRGGPDFNEFDRNTNLYARKIAKIRDALWDISDAADLAFATDDATPAEPDLAGSDAGVLQGTLHDSLLDSAPATLDAGADISAGSERSAPRFGDQDASYEALGLRESAADRRTSERSEVEDGA